MKDIRQIFIDGYMVGWDKCREAICEQYNLNKEEVITWERSDEDANCTKDEGDKDGS